jgi:hypothetical protein
VISTLARAIALVASRAREITRARTRVEIKITVKIVRELEENPLDL